MTTQGTLFPLSKEEKMKRSAELMTQILRMEGVNLVELSERTKYSPSFLGTLRNGRRPLTRTVVDELVKALGLGESWQRKLDECVIEGSSGKLPKSAYANREPKRPEPEELPEPNGERPVELTVALGFADLVKLIRNYPLTDAERNALARIVLVGE